jgi:hypothetical protein
MIRINKPLTIATMALIASLSAGSAFAASQCINIDSSVTAAGTFPGNTCPGGKPAINTGLTPFCSGDTVPNGNGAYVFSIPLGAANSGLQFTVVSTTTGFNPELAFMATTCDADPNGGACTIDETNGTQTVGPFAPNPATPAAGSYFVIVTDLAADNPGCGAFNLTVAGTLPVKLQDFSVQ